MLVIIAIHLSVLQGLIFICWKKQVDTGGTRVKNTLHSIKMRSVLQTSSGSKNIQQHIRVHCKDIRARDSGHLRSASLCFGFCHIIITLKASYLN